MNTVIARIINAVPLEMILMYITSRLIETVKNPNSPRSSRLYFIVGQLNEATSRYLQAVPPPPQRLTVQPALPQTLSFDYQSALDHIADTANPQQQPLPGAQTAPQTGSAISTAKTVKPPAPGK